MQEDNKKIDNIIDENKIKINKIDNKIEDNVKYQKNLIEINNTLNDINKEMNKCADLISKSIRGKNIDAICDDIRNETNVIIRKNTEVNEEEFRKSVKETNDLYQERMDILKNSREEVNKEEQNEKKL